MDSKSTENKLELLAPAGSPEKLRWAFHFGADAVYAGLPDFSMRYRINRFTPETLSQSVDYAHKIGKKIYVTVNIYPHNIHLEKIKDHLGYLKELKADGVILSDPGVFDLVREALPETEIHLSTQANVTNWRAAKFWADRGVKRIILAREVTLDEIREIKNNLPGVELEYFVHGAMCMSYSGRCILSKWMTGRSANLGDCSQPCRWLYSPVDSRNLSTAEDDPDVRFLSVRDRKDEVTMDLEEDNNGTYLFNSKDLNLLSYLKELAEAGVDSFKIEGRNKSVYYLAIVTRAYHQVLEAIKSGSGDERIRSIIEEQQKELGNLVHRGYTEGFLLGREPEHNLDASHEISSRQFVGEIEAVDGDIVRIKPHNALSKNDRVEAVGREGNVAFKIRKILNESGEEEESAHGGQDKPYFLQADTLELKPFSIIRKIISN